MSKMTTKERIANCCEIARRSNIKGNVIVYGKREFNMNKLFDNLTEAECDKIFKDKDLGIGAHVVQMEKKGKKKAERKATVAREAKPCECGCGEMAKPGSRFLPGHDAKLKSKLRKIVRLAETEGNKASKTTKAKAKEAKAELVSRGWA